MKRHLGLNRTTVELKREEDRAIARQALEFESNHSGIETLHFAAQLRELLIEFESNHSGIETEANV